MKNKNFILLLTIILISSLALFACNKKGEESISESEAKSIALEKFDLTKDDVRFVEVKKELDDGIEKFELEFVTEKEKFEVQINALTKEIIDFEREPISKIVDPVDSNLSEDQAKEIALDFFKLDKEDVEFRKVKKETDDGLNKVELEFKTELERFDISIDTQTSKVIEAEREIIKRIDNSKEEVLTEAQARKKVLEYAEDGSQTIEDKNIVEFKYELDDFIKVYEAEVFYNDTKYEIEIDANTGDLLKLNIEYK